MAQSDSVLKRFWQFLWAVAEGFRKLVTVLFVFVTLAVIFVLIRGIPAPEVEDNIALVWVPGGAVVERLDSDPRQELIERLLEVPPTQSRMRELVESLEAAAVDPRVSVLVLKLDELTSVGMAQLQELSHSIRRFRESGKPVYAYAPAYSQSAYYLAAQADEILMDPHGILFIEGFGLFRNYFREAIDKLGVDVHVFRVGTYKSAIEPYQRNDMSDAARASNARWLESLWSVYKREVGNAREMGPEAITAYVESFADALADFDGDAAAYAQAAGLVDTLATREEMREEVAAIVGRDDAHGSFRQIDHRRYLRATRAESTRRDEPKVGLIVAQGELIDGESRYGATGGDSLARLLSDARRDESLKALVLRIDSPGGSVYASEQIRRELALFRKSGRPLIASMSSLAASGGYWIATESDAIWAHETTITGSIGIFGLLPTFQKPLERLGVHNDGVGTTSWSGALRPDRELSPDVKKSIQLMVEHGYDRFIQRVVDGRGMERDAVEKIAEGRVWSGSDAEQFGLVDAIGGLRSAADAAARLAGLQPGKYELQVVQGPQDFRMKLIERFSGAVSAALPASLRTALSTWSPLSAMPGLPTAFSDPSGLYAHCECNIALSRPFRASATRQLPAL